MIVVDSCVIISFLMPKDPLHHIAVKWIEENLKHELVAPELALVEVSGCFARQRQSEEFISNSIAFIRDNFTLIEMDADLINTSIDFARKCAIRGADAIFAATTHSEDAKYLATFDAELAERAGKIITTVNLKEKAEKAKS